MLEKTKLDKVLPRLVKRGDDRGKSFAQKILDNAANNSSYKDTSEKSIRKPQTNGATVKKASADVIEGKQERLSGSKLSTDLSAKGSSQVPASKTASVSDSRQRITKGDTKPSVKPTGTDASSTKIKTTQIATKPTSFFAGLKSASKKPGTSAKPEESKSRWVIAGATESPLLHF